MEKLKPPHKIFLSEEATFELIEEFKAHPCLWQKGSKDYKSQFKKCEALKKISSKFDLKSEALREKWKSLRTIYFQNVKKFDKMKGKGRRGVLTQPRWKFFGALSFLQAENAASELSDGFLSESSVRYDDLGHSQISIEIPSGINEEKTIISAEGKTKKEVYNGSHHQSSAPAVANFVQIKSDNEAFAHYVSSSLDQIKDQSVVENVKCKIRLLLSNAITLDTKSQLASHEQCE